MKINVAVLFGGRSVENEISVVTANQAIQAIDKQRYNIIPIFISKSGVWYSGDNLLDVNQYRDLDSLLKSCEQVYIRPIYGDSNLYRTKKSLFRSEVVSRIDVILPALHGTNCEDGTFQGVIEFAGIPYAGCNTLASANGMDKITMKMILKECGIPVVDYAWFCDKEWFESRESVVAKVEAALSYPVIVKPANSGSSIGIKAAKSREELIEAIENAISFTTRVIVEAFVSELKEVNCSVLGDYYNCEASVLEVPMRNGDILSYEDKYMGGGAKQQSKGMQSTVREIPANLPDEVTEFIRTKACETFTALSCDGVSRIDFIIDESCGKIYVNEINTIPGSLSFYLWEHSGVDFSALVDRLIEIAFQRQREYNNKVVNYGGNIFASLNTSAGKMGGSKIGGAKM
ncbi:MAG: D-alanine--D-alanine ligase family protein [Rikenellaceae bacterium]